jgi:hypothetical protein
VRARGKERQKGGERDTRAAASAPYDAAPYALRAPTREKGPRLEREGEREREGGREGEREVGGERGRNCKTFPKLLGIRKCFICWLEARARPSSRLGETSAGHDRSNKEMSAGDDR